MNVNLFHFITTSKTKKLKKDFQKVYIFLILFYKKIELAKKTTCRRIEGRKKEYKTKQKKQEVLNKYFIFTFYIIFEKSCQFCKNKKIEMKVKEFFLFSTDMWKERTFRSPKCKHPFFPYSFFPLFLFWSTYKGLFLMQVNLKKFPFLFFFSPNFSGHNLCDSEAKKD